MFVAVTELMRLGCGGSRRAPWEGKVWRAAPLPATPVCAEQLAEGRLLLSTTSNTYILEGNLNNYKTILFHILKCYKIF